MLRSRKLPGSGSAVRLMTLATWALSNGETMSAQPTVKTKKQRRAEFQALLDSLSEIPFGFLAWGEDLVPESIEQPDPRNYRGADWSEVG